MARLIGENNATAWIFFVPFVALAGLGLMNLLTAVFVEALMEQTKAHAQKLKWQKEQVSYCLAIMQVCVSRLRTHRVVKVEPDLEMTG